MNRGINSFFNTLTFLFVVLIILSYIAANKNSTRDFKKGSIVIQKSKTDFLGTYVLMLQENDSTFSTKKVYQIDYLKYQIGDTIK